MSARTIQLGLVLLLALGFVDPTDATCCCREPKIPAPVEGDCCGGPVQPASAGDDEGCCPGGDGCDDILRGSCQAEAPLAAPQSQGSDVLVDAVDLTSDQTPDRPEGSDPTVVSAPVSHDPPLFTLNSSFLI